MTEDVDYSFWFQCGLTGKYLTVSKGHCSSESSTYLAIVEIMAFEGYNIRDSFYVGESRSSPASEGSSEGNVLSDQFKLMTAKIDSCYASDNIDITQEITQV